MAHIRAKNEAEATIHSRLPSLPQALRFILGQAAEAFYLPTLRGSATDTLA